MLLNLSRMKMRLNLFLKEQRKEKKRNFENNKKIYDENKL
jgi:hypothetical protein